MRPVNVNVQPGEVHVSDTPRMFKTILGSCVSVCLWDPVRRAGGLNHYMLPRLLTAPDSARFGTIAIPQLIAKLREFDCQSLVAKVFGGASVLPIGPTPTIGESNIELAMLILAEHRIPVVAQRTGGLCGIVIRYSSLDGGVLVSEIPISDKPPMLAHHQSIDRQVM